jgi:hypothetical protein
MKDGRGHFFAIDRRVWAHLCDQGALNPPVAYLVLAAGTGWDNQTTAWSTQAVSTYAGMGVERAKAAIEHLVRDGFVMRPEDFSKTKPRYQLVSFEGEQTGQAQGENFIWLPNTLVTGTSKGEDSPVRRLRGAGDIWALRLLVDLYYAQNLRDDGGIDPRIMREGFDRTLVAEQGIYSVWGFKRSLRTHWWSGPFIAHKKRKKSSGASESPSWESFTLLEKMGLLYFVPHLFENDSPEAQPIHACGIGCSGEESLETEIGNAADTAARAMAVWRIEAAERNGFEYFCPVVRTYPNVQLVGVSRLRYRPRTSRTAAWYAQLQESGPIWIAKYRQMASKAELSQPESFSNFA